MVMSRLRNSLVQARLHGFGDFPNVDRLFGKVTEFIRGNPLTAGAVIGITGAVGTAGLVAAVRKKVKKKTTRKKSSKTYKKKKTSKRRTSKKRIRKTPRTAGKGKDRSTKRIRHTKKGQPYIILKSGKARFIKKSSARRSRRLKGGRY